MLPCPRSLTLDGAVLEGFFRPVSLAKSLFVCRRPVSQAPLVEGPPALAPVLQTDKVLQDRFDQGAQVGALARDFFSGGVLVDTIGRSHEERTRLTQEAIEAGTPAIFEATFEAHAVRVKVDVLLRETGGWRLIEVKSTSSQKDEHLPDAAVQLLSHGSVKRSNVEKATVMGLNVAGFRATVVGRG